MYVQKNANTEFSEDLTVCDVVVLLYICEMLFMVSISLSELLR